LLVESGIEIAGAHVVVLGRSMIVGKPVAMLLMQKAKHANATGHGGALAQSGTCRRSRAQPTS
jgi:methylenetetrahydrofolate dehydrogenase (NADP+)/methenyltetrahydrofolate cyclohydrolase